jgi:hypothetical protein
VSSQDRRLTPTIINDHNAASRTTATRLQLGDHEGCFQLHMQVLLVSCRLPLLFMACFLNSLSFSVQQKKFLQTLEGEFHVEIEGAFIHSELSTLFLATNERCVICTC